MGLTALFLMMALPVQAPATTNLYLDPSNTVGPPPDIGDTLTLTLRVNNVTDLVMFAVDIVWDPTKLEYVSWTEGACLKSNDKGLMTICLVASIVPGKITDLSCVILGASPGDGVDVPPKPDDCASFEFKVLNYTCDKGTWINMTMHELYNADTEEIHHTATNAKFTLSCCLEPIYSCDKDGTAKDEYLPDDIIYVAVFHPTGCQEVTIYVVKNQSRWEPCMSPPDVTNNGPDFVHLAAGWNYIPLGWIPGAKFCDYYDIWVDANNNEHYDECEPVDGLKVPGFHIIPELAGTLMGLGACIVAFGAFKYKRFRKH